MLESRHESEQQKVAAKINSSDAAAITKFKSINPEKYSEITDAQSIAKLVFHLFG